MNPPADPNKKESRVREEEYSMPGVQVVDGISGPRHVGGSTGVVVRLLRYF